MRFFVCTLTLCLMLVSSAEAASPGRGQGNYTPRTERGQLAGEFVRRFSPYVSRSQGIPPLTWAHMMESTFRQADIHNLRRAVRQDNYAAAMSVLLGQLPAASLPAAAATTPLDAAAVGPANNLVLTLIQPCRIADTRLVGGKVAAGTVRSFNSSNPGGDFGFQGGNPASDCGIPADPSVLLLRFTAAGASSSGYFTVYPFNAPQPSTPSLKYSTTSASSPLNETVRQSIGMDKDFSVYTSATTHVVVDVVGYYMAPPAVELECQVTEENVVSVAAGAPVSAFAPDCPAGFTEVETRCHFFFTDDSLSGVGEGACHGRAGPSATQLFARRKCCRVPGR
jgi:hypothetical protein